MDNLLRFHHIGIVVKSIEKAIQKYILFCGKENNIILETVASQHVRIALVSLAANIYIEYIEPIDSDSPVYEYSNKGGGIHHVCFSVENLLLADQFMADTYRRISGMALGLMGKPMLFYYSKDSTLGEGLIELLEIKRM